MSSATSALEAYITEQNARARSKPATAGIYIYSNDDRTSPFVKKVLGRGDPAGNRYFSHLSDAIMEALDVPPAVLILDVHVADGLLHAHVERLRTAAECRDMAILIRTQTLSEADVLSLISLEVNHIALTFSPLTPILQEIDQLLAMPQRRGRISNVVAVLGTKIGARLSGTTDAAMPDSLLNKFERHYGFSLRAHDVPRQRSSSTWGFIPVSNDAIAVFAVHITANALNARRHAKRANALLTAPGFEAASPAATLGYLRDHLGPFLLPNEQIQAAYLTFDRKSRAARFAGAHGAIAFGPQPKPSLLPPTGAAITATTTAEITEVPLTLPGRGGFVLPFAASATSLAASLAADTDLPPGADAARLAQSLRRDTAWLTIEFSAPKDAHHATA